MFISRSKLLLPLLLLAVAVAACGSNGEDAADPVGGTDGGGSGESSSEAGETTDDVETEPPSIFESFRSPFDDFSWPTGFPPNPFEDQWFVGQCPAGEQFPIVFARERAFYLTPSFDVTAPEIAEEIQRLKDSAIIIGDEPIVRVEAEGIVSREIYLVDANQPIPDPELLEDSVLAPAHAFGLHMGWFAHPADLPLPGGGTAVDPLNEDMPLFVIDAARAPDATERLDALTASGFQTFAEVLAVQGEGDIARGAMTIHGGFIEAMAQSQTSRWLGVPPVSVPPDSLDLILDPIETVAAAGALLRSPSELDGAAVNMSFGTHTCSASSEVASEPTALLAVIDEIVGFGGTVVASAGNNGSDQPVFPAASPNVIGVGSLAHGGGRSCFSNFGAWVDTWRLGEEIEAQTSTMPGPYTWSGTSFAAPQVAIEILNNTTTAAAERQTGNDPDVDAGSVYETCPPPTPE